MSKTINKLLQSKPKPQSRILYAMLRAPYFPPPTLNRLLNNGNKSIESSLHGQVEVGEVGYKCFDAIGTDDEGADEATFVRREKLVDVSVAPVPRTMNNTSEEDDVSVSGMVIIYNRYIAVMILTIDCIKEILLQQSPLVVFLN
uniref:Uncharacterized protein n=1 Tax=Glossina austeni TaxID=7395 RepID=A0A1A9UYV3_GLOAU